MKSKNEGAVRGRISPYEQDLIRARQSPVRPEILLRPKHRFSNLLIVPKAYAAVSRKVLVGRFLHFVNTFRVFVHTPAVLLAVYSRDFTAFRAFLRRSSLIERIASRVSSSRPRSSHISSESSTALPYFSTAYAAPPFELLEILRGLHTVSLISESAADFRDCSLFAFKI